MNRKEVIGNTSLVFISRATESVCMIHKAHTIFYTFSLIRARISHAYRYTGQTCISRLSILRHLNGFTDENRLRKDLTPSTIWQSRNEKMQARRKREQERRGRWIKVTQAIRFASIVDRSKDQFLSETPEKWPPFSQLGIRIIAI